MLGSRGGLVKRRPGLVQVVRGWNPTRPDDAGSSTARHRLRRWRQWLPAGTSGVIVSRVEPMSPAFDASIERGHVVLEINRQPVRNADEAVAMSEKAKGDRILLRVWRGGEGRGGMLFLSVDNTKRK